MVPDPRTRLLRAGMATSLLQRSVGALVPLISVPLALGQLGLVGYGAWSTAVALTGVFVFSDLGIGTGLMTRLGGSANEDHEKARAYVSSAYVLVGGLAVAAIATLLIVGCVFDVAAWFGAPGRSTVEAIVMLTLAGFLINVVVSLVVRVQYAVGQQAASNLWQSASSLAMLGGMWLAADVTTGPTWFICAAVFLPILMGVANTCWFFSGPRRGALLRPNLLIYSPQLAMELLRLGSKFVLVSVLLAAAVALDPWIIARTTELGEVPNYAVPYRVLSVAGLISVAIAMPLWPMHAAAVRAGDVVWIQKVTRRLTVTATVAMAALTAIIVAWADFLVGVWLGDRIQVIPELWAGMALFVIAQAATGPMFMLQNAAEVLAPQMLAYAAVLLTLPIKWVVSERVGYELIPWITAAAYIGLVGPACVIGYRKALFRAQHHLEGRA